MTGTNSTTDVIVVGAGMAGLTAATELAKAGVSSIVLDKGRAPGGRMATRTINGARFDHGAQHFSARSDAFRERVAHLRDIGIVAEWYEATSWTTPGSGKEPRLVGSGGMRCIPEHIATGLDVRTSVEVGRLELGQGLTVLAGGHPVAHGSAVILTPPAPQLLGLLQASELRLESEVAERLGAIEYNLSLTVMVTLDAPSGLPHGHIAQPSVDVAWMADNQHKGTSEIPAVTIHSTAHFARDHFDDDPQAWRQRLVAQVTPHLAGGVVAETTHRWRFAEPQTTFDVGAITINGPTPVVLAGEVFAGAKVEGAFLSGLAAAEAVLDRL